PQPHVRPIAEGEQRRVAARPKAHRPHRPRIAPRPRLAVQLRVAEAARVRGRARAGEHLPAALVPDPVVDRSVRPPRRVLGDVLRHLLLRGDGDLPEVVDAADVRRLEADAIELAAIERDALVGEAYRHTELVALDRVQLV